MRIPFQAYENADITGLVKESNLAYRGFIAPQQADKVISLIHAVNRGASVKAYLEKFPILYLEDERDFTWRLATTGKKNVPLVRCSLTSGGSAISASDQVGKAGAEFYLVFEEAYFTDVNIIVGERLEVYQIQIQDNPRPLGSNWEYRCVLFASSDDTFIPYDELVAGKRFSKDFSIVEQELSVKGGGVHYDFPFEMINQFTMIRMENTIPGNMIKKKVEFDFVAVDANGKKQQFTTWLPYASYQLEMQFEDEIASMTMYSRSNKREDGTYKEKGKSGNIIKQGAGIKQQMEASNYYTYNNFNISEMTEMMLDLTIGKTVMGERAITISTGEWGMYQWSKALEEYTMLYTPNRTQDRIFKSGNDTLGYRGQFLDYIGPNGLKLTIIHDALKDDIARNVIDMPGQPGRAESYVYDILGMGTSDGSPNIQRVQLKEGGLIRGYEEGLRSPYTMSASEHPMSTRVDGWTEHRAYTGGARVKDPERTGTYKPACLA